MLYTKCDLSVLIQAKPSQEAAGASSTSEVIAMTADTYLLPLPMIGWLHYEFIVFLVFTQQDLCI